MDAKALTPILNVSNIIESFAWFEKFGWKKHWDWGTPPTFGAVISAKCEIFLCQGAQGGRGKSALATTSGSGAAGDKGVWMSIWVEDVDAIHRHCLEHGLEVTMPPIDEPWGVPRDARPIPGWSRLPDQQGIGRVVSGTGLGLADGDIRIRPLEGLDAFEHRGIVFDQGRLEREPELSEARQRAELHQAATGEVFALEVEGR